jgi:hypothetical protein
MEKNLREEFYSPEKAADLVDVTMQAEGTGSGSNAEPRTRKSYFRA